MASYASFTFLGNLTRDPELRYTPKGSAVVQFGLAVNRRWKTDSGEEKEKVSFFDLQAFGNSAETIAKHVKKGDCLFVTGRPEQETWEDKNGGGKRSKIIFNVDVWQFAGGKPSGDGKAAPSAPAGRTAPPPNDVSADSDDDSPPPF